MNKIEYKFVNYKQNKILKRKISYRIYIILLDLNFYFLFMIYFLNFLYIFKIF